jgi:FMN phosphatase YigB (HAD superfamily)
MMNCLEDALQQELDSIKAYQDGIDAVSLLQAAGVPVGICSNLAKPYAAAVERLYPSIMLRAYSFEAGAVKPSPRMFAYATAVMGAKLPGEIALIGDSARCDRDGACEYGMEGYLLCRAGKGNYSSLVDFARGVIAGKAG